MESAVKLYSLSYSNVKTYGAALLFVIGNIALPQLFHLVPQGGMTWLPIYFFTLVGAYKYGWKVGLLTAINACSGGASGYFAEVGLAGGRCRMGGSSFSESIGIDFVGCSVVLPMHRYVGRMGVLCR